MKFETDPDVMQLCAHYLANQIHFTKAKLELFHQITTLSDEQKAVLRTAWDCARSTETRAKELRRDQEWKTWATLSHRPKSAWKEGEKAAQVTEDLANRASADLQAEDYKQAAMRLFQATFSASQILEDYGYDKMGTDLSRQGFLVHLLPNLDRRR